MTEEKKGEKYTASVKLQIVSGIIFSIIVSWLLYIPLQQFKSEDEFPALVSLTPQKILNFGGAPSFVTVGMYIRDIPTFDIIEGHFVIDTNIWFRFDPRLVSLDRISQFTFDRAKILKRSEPYTRIEGNKLLARYDMRIEFNTTLNYDHFPLDDHQINFSITNFFLTPSDIVFQSSTKNLALNPKIQISGWKCIDKEIKTGFLEDKLDPNDPKSIIYNPRVVFSLDFARTGVRHIVSILLPLLLIFFISITTFTFNPYGRNGGNIISVSIASITAVIAYRFVIDRMSPDVGYFMLSDYVFLFLLVSCCTIFVVNLFSMKISGFFKNILTIILYLINIAIFIYIFKPLI